MQIAAKSNEAPYHYRIAGMHVVSDSRLNTALASMEALSGLELLTIQSGKPKQILQSSSTKIPTKKQLTFNNEEGDTWLSIDFYPNGVRASIPTVADYYYQPDERLLQISPDEDSEAAVVEHFVLALVLPLVCALEGKLVMHASAIANQNGAVLFIGASGSGKSTVACAASEQGWSVLADDFVVIERELGFSVLSTSSSVRLRPDVLSLFPELNPANIREILAKTNVVGIEAALGKYPLKKIIFLVENDTSITSAQAAFQKMLAQVFFGFKVCSERRASQFEMLAEIVKSVECLSLNPKNTDNLFEALLN